MGDECLKSVRCVAIGADGVDCDERATIFPYPR